MELNKNRWYVQWLFLSLHIMGCFTGNNKEYTFERHGTNLCQFMRVTLVWAPLAVLLNLAVYGLLLSALIFVPLHYFGMMSALTIYGVILAVIAALALLLVLVLAAGKLVVSIRNRSQDLSYALQKRKARAAARRAIRGPSFGEVIWHYVVATKRRICPTITFNERTL